MTLTESEWSDTGPWVALTTLILASCTPLGAAAQENSAALETLVVTGTRIADSSNPLLASSALDIATIEARNDSNVLDLLSDLPGVHVNLPGGRGNVGEIFLRGGEPNFTSVMIDGVQVNDPTNTRGGSFDFSTLNLDDIERVEILRGPASSVYGSDALSGAINVITRGSTDAFAGSVNVEFGEGDYQRGSLRFSGPAGESSGFSVGVGTIEEGNADSPDSFESDSVTVKADLARDSRTSVSIYARHNNADSSGFPDSSGGPRLAVIRDKASRASVDSALSVALTSRLSPKTEFHVAATTYDHQERTMSPGVAPGIGPGIPANRSDNDFSRVVLNAFVQSQLASRIDAAFGLGFQEENGDSIGQLTLAPGFDLPTGYSLSRDDVNAYGELAFDADNGLDFVAGARIDETDAAGRQTTGRLALAYGFANDSIRVRLGWGDAFKLPSLFALADPLVGNPDLRPELVSSWELGVDLLAMDNALQWQITAFRQRFEDLIDFDFESFAMVNRNRVNSDGIEIGGQYQPTEQLSFFTHLTYTDIDVLDSTATLTQRPELRGGVGLYWTISASLTAHAGWQYIGERFDSSIPTGELVLSSYTRLDLALNWEIGNSIRLKVAVDNATDTNYEEAIGFPATGRRMRISVQKAFGEDLR